MVAHAADQDLAILERLCGQSPDALFDTQVAAGFLGMGAPSLGVLVERMLGLKLAKGDRLTDWTTRPLRDEQQQYAVADVEHLLALRDVLVERLVDEGRLQWALDECETRLQRDRTGPTSRPPGGRSRGRGNCAGRRAASRRRSRPGVSARPRPQTCPRVSCSPTSRSRHSSSARPAPPTSCARSAGSRPATCATAPPARSSTRSPPASRSNRPRCASRRRKGSIDRCNPPSRSPARGWRNGPRSYASTPACSRPGPTSRNSSATGPAGSRPAGAPTSSANRCSGSCTGRPPSRSPTAGAGSNSRTVPTR